MRAAGDPAVCGAGTDEGPQANCASPIQVFLSPLPGRAAEEGPPGAVKVDFVSGNPASRWDVYADDQVVCTTPCARWVDPHRPVMLRTREGGGFMGPPSDRVQVPNLLEHAGQPHLQLQAHGTAHGKLVTGITFTALSGMAALTGVTLTALGCSGGSLGPVQRWADLAGRRQPGPDRQRLPDPGRRAPAPSWSRTTIRPPAACAPAARACALGPGVVAGTF